MAVVNAPGRCRAMTSAREPDTLPMLNHKTGPKLKILLRVSGLRCDHVTQKPPGKAFTVVKAKLIDMNGEYCGFEQHIWGEESHRLKQAKAVMLHYANGHVFEFSSMKSVRVANEKHEFYSQMQVIKAVTDIKGVVNCLTAIPVLKGASEERSLPMIAISRTSLADLVWMHQGRTVDVTCIVLEVMKLSRKPGPDYSIMLAEDADVKYKCNVWQADPEVDYQSAAGCIATVNAFMLEWMGNRANSASSPQANTPKSSLLSKITTHKGYRSLLV